MKNKFSYPIPCSHIFLELLDEPKADFEPVTRRSYAIPAIAKVLASQLLLHLDHFNIL